MRFSILGGSIFFSTNTSLSTNIAGRASGDIGLGTSTSGDTSTATGTGVGSTTSTGVGAGFGTTAARRDLKIQINNK